MKYELSVIIPAYNCHQYIGDCLSSIFLQQDAALHQVIVVDDGSTDGTGDIVRLYQTKYPNLRLIRQANAGVSVARNVGLDAAQGEYVTFVDSDDMIGLNKPVVQQYLQQHISTIDIENAFRSVYRIPASSMRLRFENEYFSRMLGVAHQHKADIVMGSCFTFDPYLGALYYYSYKSAGPNTQKLRGNDILRLVAVNQGSLLENANYLLYRRDMLVQNNLRFTPGMQLNEDLLFAMQATLLANTICTAGDSTYFYKRRNGSLSNIKGRYPNEAEIWKTQVYISAVLLSDMRMRGYRQTYNLFQQQQAHILDDMKYYGPDRENVPVCRNCQLSQCTYCNRDSAVWAQIQKNIETYRPLVCRNLTKGK